LLAILLLKFGIYIGMIIQFARREEETKAHHEPCGRWDFLQLFTTAA